MKELFNMFKLLSDETRLRILILLRKKKLCVCQIYGVLEESQPKISKHLAKLRDSGLIKDEKIEQYVYYYINSNDRIFLQALDGIIDSIELYPKLKNDLIRLDTYADGLIEKCDIKINKDVKVWKL